MGGYLETLGQSLTLQWGMTLGWSLATTILRYPTVLMAW